MAVRDAIAALLGISTYQPGTLSGPSISDPAVERIREMQGGQLSPLPHTLTRWYLNDLEAAMHSADSGNIRMAAQLARAMRRDGVLAGLLSTTSGGLVRLPKRFSGRSDIVADLEGRDGCRSRFDDMFPASELEVFAADADVLGVAVGELCPVQGRSFPVFIRLEPEFLSYIWSENRWYYNSVAGRLPITPGDGRWVLHTRGGRIAPWQQGLWPALGRAWINKEHALLHKANWEAKLANPARAAYSPNAATEGQRQGFLQSLIAWGVNTVFELPAGWDVKIIESNGRGWESFKDTIEWAEREYMIALAGQVVTVTGGTGFANGDMHKSIRADLIEARADALAHTINTQGIPAYVLSHYGEEALDECPSIEWDTTPPRDLAIEAQAMLSTAQAVSQMAVALAPYGMRLDIREIAHRFALPLSDIPVPTAQGDELEGQVVSDSGHESSIVLAPTDLASIVTVNEARHAQGLGPIPDGELTIVDFRAKHAASIATVNEAENGKVEDSNVEGGAPKD